MRGAKKAAMVQAESRPTICRVVDRESSSRLPLVVAFVSFCSMFLLSSRIMLERFGRKGRSPRGTEVNEGNEEN
jgi:hypothetical protein